MLALYATLSLCGVGHHAFDAAEAHATVEGETGMSNAIVAPRLFEKLRLMITQESFLMIEGPLQNSEGVILIQARRIARLAHEDSSCSSSYDFH